MDGVSLVMFIIPIVMALAFSFASIFGEPSDTDPVNLAGFLSSVIATICWFISALTWVGFATMEVLMWVGWLWFGLFWVFLPITLVRGFQMLKASVSLKPNKMHPLELREREQEERD
jgi:hypothetical protein